MQPSASGNTVGPVEPSRLSFRCTPLTLDLCRRFDFVSQWAPSIARSVETGELFSQARTLDDPAAANQRGQHYQGPVVLVTDALGRFTVPGVAPGSCGWTRST